MLNFVLATAGPLVFFTTAVFPLWRRTVVAAG